MRKYTAIGMALVLAVYGLAAWWTASHGRPIEAALVAVFATLTGFGHGRRWTRPLDGGAR